LRSTPGNRRGHELLSICAEKGNALARSKANPVRELFVFNKGRCVITTRMPVADIANHERTEHAL
jgi:hypothetical protein